MLKGGAVLRRLMAGVMGALTTNGPHVAIRVRTRAPCDSAGRCDSGVKIPQGPVVLPAFGHFPEESANGQRAQLAILTPLSLADTSSRIGVRMRRLA